MRPAGLIENITYWGPGQENQFGVRTHALPILIKGRWQNIHAEVHTIGGNVVNSNAFVYADRDLSVNGYLAQGDQTATSEPVSLPEAWEILDYREDNDMRGCSKLRRAVL